MWRVVDGDRTEVGYGNCSDGDAVGCGDADAIALDGEDAVIVGDPMRVVSRGR